MEQTEIIVTNESNAMEITNRIKSGKILTLFITSTTVKSGPVIWLLSTLE